MEWINAKERLPDQDEKYWIRLNNGEEVKAYFYKDRMQWTTFYGKKPSYWWRCDTKEPLFNVKEWKERND